MNLNLINAKTKTGFENAVSSGTVTTNDLGFIQDSKQIWAKNNYYSAIPSGGQKGQFLTWKSSGEAQWTDLDVINLLAYGVEWDITVADPILTRIGNPLLHKQLPIQSAFRGCVTQGEEIMYYLDASDWSLKENGEASRLDGYDGTVRVHTPRFYGKGEESGNKRRVLVSTQKIDETWTEIPEMLIDAYRSTVLNTVPENMGYLSTLPVNSAVSIVNTNNYCRGGNNSSTYDQYLTDVPCRSLLGKPRTSLSRATIRTYCRNAGSEMLSYEQYKWIFYWLWVIEYATFNSQAAFNSELTSDGYHQGGLGNGITTINGTYWIYYNNTNPLTPCGYCNNLGNGTGVKEMTVITPTTSGGDPTQTYTFQVPRWRGFDNPFGDIWTNLDGVIVDADADNHSNSMDHVYTCSDPAKFADELTSDYVKIAESTHSVGYVKAFDLGDTANIIASQIGGSSTTFMCDYHWTGNANTTLRQLLVGGRADYNTGMGLGALSSAESVSASHMALGFRSVSARSSVGVAFADYWDYI